MNDKLAEQHTLSKLAQMKGKWKELGSKLVVYNHDLNEANIGMLSPLEQNAFFYACAKVRGMEGTDINISFDEYRKATKFPARKSDKDMIASFDKVSDALKFFEFRNRLYSYGFEKGAIFTYFKADPNTKTITIRVNDRYLYLFNKLEEDGFYTRFDYENFTEIESKHGKTLFRILSQWRSVGKTPVFKLEYFKFLTGTEKYRDRDVRDKVITPAVEECSKFFRNLEAVYSEDRMEVYFKFTKNKILLENKETI